MSLIKKLPKSHHIVEGDVHARLGETLGARTLDVTNWGTTTPVSATLTVIRDRDETDVTSAFIPSGSASISTTTITFPDIVIPSTAELGSYVVTVEYDDNAANNPSRPWFELVVGA